MKRAIDLIVAALGIIILFPLFLLLVILVRVKLGSPIFFRQARGGLNGREFNIIKFRSMSDRRDEEGKLLPDGERLTSFGHFLRKTSLDELPELFNILKGEMSLVGPRPLLIEYLDLYTSEQFRRHDVKPGITGWAQINGRNALTWEDRFRLDTWYIDHQSFRLDLKILVMTIISVITRKGISASNHPSMPKFTGQ